MSASSDLQFVIFCDVKDGYKWRLSAASGQTVEYSERGYSHKDECEHDVYRLKDDQLSICQGARRGDWVNGHVGLAPSEADPRAPAR
jgi:uncharacterized protein YegP (UPF0339 family)